MSGILRTQARARGEWRRKTAWMTEIPRWKAQGSTKPDNHLFFITGVKKKPKRKETT